MKALKIILTLLLIFFISTLLFSQDIKVHNMISKKQSEVINIYGQPAHKDNSNPAMMCMFYKRDGNSYIFVSNKEGVYQAEATEIYDSEKSARKDVDDFISESLSDGYSVDTISVSDFHLDKPGVKADLQMSENKISKKYEIRVKANRTED